MPADFTVRTATRDDIDALVAFNQAMAKETEDKELSADRLRPGVAGVFADPRRGFYLVVDATTNNTTEVAGALMLTYEWSDWRNGDFWWIQSVYVRSHWRRHGIYRALYGEVKTRAAAADGVCGVRLYVERENTVAQNVYATLGMHETAYRLYEEEFAR